MNQLSPVKAIRRLKINCSSSTSKPMRAPLRREVSFGRIQVVEFAPALGDNPFVSKGAPIALGTKKIHEMHTPVDLYEFVRQPLRRHGSDLAMKPKLRAEILLSEGYDKTEINNAAQEAWIAKKSIEQSASMKNWDAFHERMESTRRVLKRVVAPVAGNPSRQLKRSASK